MYFVALDPGLIGDYVCVVAILYICYSEFSEHDARSIPVAPYVIESIRYLCFEVLLNEQIPLRIILNIPAMKPMLNTALSVARSGLCTTKP